VSSHPLAPYDACVVLSFGGPEGPDEVLPFLRRVTAGRGIPEERLTEVGAHYALFGGVSPINAQNRALVAALAAELDRRGAALPVLLANRNSPPFLADVLAGQPSARVLVVLTSAWRSYSSCRQYREDLARAATGLDVVLDKLPPYADHPAYAPILARLLGDALLADQPTADQPTADQPTADQTTAPQVERVLTVAHSVPIAMDAAAGPPEDGGQAYTRRLQAVTDQIETTISARIGRPIPHELTFCSRSGPPTQPWLEPDVGDRLEALAAEGVGCVALAPIGFVSDHMEVVYDLDTQARSRAEEAGIRLLRTPTVGTDPEFVALLADLALERAAQARATPDERDSDCAAGCCRNLRADLPTRCGR
jgi:ferrochelatase